MNTVSYDKTIGHYIAGFPNHDIFRGVVDALVEERWLILQEVYLRCYLSDERARGKEFSAQDVWGVTLVLGRMSLVHRTWTSTAQHALRRCAVVQNGKDRRSRVLLAHHLRTVLRSPCLAFADAFVFQNAGVLSEEEMVLLKEIILYPFQRTLQILHLELVLDGSNPSPRSRSVHQRNSSSLTSLLECLATLGSLKTLSLEFNVRQIHDRYNFIDSACYAITHLHCLESFRLYERGAPLIDPPDFEESPRLLHAHPPPSLKSLHIAIEHPHDHMLSWLTTPRAGYQLEHVTVFSPDYCTDPELSAIRQSIPFLRSLSIDASSLLIDEDSDYSQSRFLFTEIMREALSIEALTLRFYIEGVDRFNDFETITMSSLPPAIQRLSLLFLTSFSRKKVEQNNYTVQLDEVVSQIALSVNRKGSLRVIVYNSGRYVNISYTSGDTLTIETATTGKNSRGKSVKTHFL